MAPPAIEDPSNSGNYTSSAQVYVESHGHLSLFSRSYFYHKNPEILSIYPQYGFTDGGTPILVELDAPVYGSVVYCRFQFVSDYEDFSIIESGLDTWLCNVAVSILLWQMWGSVATTEQFYRADRIIELQHGS